MRNFTFKMIFLALGLASAQISIAADAFNKDIPGSGIKNGIPFFENYAPLEPRSNPNPRYDLEDISAKNIAEIKKSSATENKVTEFKKEALIELASSLGASAGLAAKTTEIREQLNKYGYQLDNLYNFSKVKIHNGVLPPVLTEGLANYSKASDDEVRIADQMFKIEVPAKFVSVYPTWRDYLQFTFGTFELPEDGYLPQTEEEAKIWDTWVKRGWEKGQAQALNIFEASWSRLNRDFNGMIKFKVLQAQGLVSPTLVAKSNLGVTGGGREMAINDQIFRIVDHSALIPDQKRWTTQYPVTYEEIK